jgi:ubiquinone/menaquinone biosynthesis C-methylase UbiE
MSQADPTTYALGHSPAEIERLGTQAAVIDPMTRRTFEEAGISSGMRVLDIGSGPGYIATMVAEMVGSEGEVVGTDINPTALATARSRCAALGFRNVTFHQGDPSTMAFDRPFDAVVGRYILMFLPDPAAMLRTLAKNLRPAGVMAFHEIAWSGARSSPRAPLFDKCCSWLAETLPHLGSDPEMAMHLSSAFNKAGLPAPFMRVQQQIGTRETAFEAVRLVTDLLSSMMPSVIDAGAATEEEVGIKTLHGRVMNEIIANGSTVMGRLEAGAWCRLP